MREERVNDRISETFDCLPNSMNRPLADVHPEPTYFLL